MDEGVTRGIESLEISIAYYVQQTSDYLDLYDYRFQQVREHPDWIQSEIGSNSITLESIKAELARRLDSGAFDKNISLADRWAKPDLHLSDDELAAMLDEISGEREQNLDDFLRED